MPTATGGTAPDASHKQRLILQGNLRMQPITDQRRQRGRRFPNDAFYSTCKKINRHKTARKDWHFIPIHDWQFNELNFCPPLFLAREMARSISPGSIQDSNVSAFSKH
jgi:hypothetical protein